MSAIEPVSEPCVTANVTLAVGSRRLQLQLSVPVGPTPTRFALPVMQQIVDAAVAAIGEDAATLKQPISCRVGCSACCHHLVPISPIEARNVLDVIDSMPAPRREEVHARFAHARRRLEEAGVLEDLANPRIWDGGGVGSRSEEYFHLGIACPLLEGGACSIYADRPLICRQYMVVTPAEWCSDPKANKIQVPQLPFDSWETLARTAGEGPEGRNPWIPLVLAPEWARANPEPAPIYTGPELIQRLFAELTGKQIPSPPSQEPSCPPPV